MTAKERTSLDRDIKDILKEMDERQSHHHVSSLKQFAWRITVRGTYVVKRFADLVLSELALIALSPLFLLLIALMFHFYGRRAWRAVLIVFLAVACSDIISSGILKPLRNPV